MDSKEKEQLRNKIVDAMSGGTYKFNRIRLSCLDEVLEVVEKFIDEKEIKKSS